MKAIKKITLIAFVFLLVQCSNSDKKDSEKKQENQTVTKTEITQQEKKEPDVQIKTDAKPGFATKHERGRKRRESIKDKFDDFGNLIERTDNMYDKFGNIKRKNKYTYKYDDSGNRIEQWFYAIAPNGAPIMSNVNHAKYNRKGFKTENIFISYDKNGKEANWAKNVYVYNKDNRVIEDTRINKDGYKVSGVKYIIEDDLLKREEFLKYNPDGSISETKTIIYDEQGNIIN